MVFDLHVYTYKHPGVPPRYFKDRGSGGGGGGRGEERVRGATEVHNIVYPKKPQLQNLSTPKIPTILAYPKNSHTSSKLCLCQC